MNPNNKEYDYSTISNLVLYRENAPKDNGPSGEPDTLTGRALNKFGDKSVKEKIPIDRKIKQKKTNDRAISNVYNPKKKTKLETNKEVNVLDLNIGEQLIYRPKTKETQSVYEELLSLIHHHIPDQDPNILKGALDSILAIIKTDDIRDSQRMSEVEAIIGKITPEEFNKIYQISKGLVDYTISEEKDEENDIEVPLEFENEDEESIVDIEDDNEEEENFDDEAKGTMIGINQEREESEDEKEELNLEKIDGFWLQNQIRNLFDDNQVLKMEDEIMNILALGDKRECENKLVLLLSQERFSLIKVLLDNRYEIYYLTKIGQSQSEKEKLSLLDEMSHNIEGQKVLQKIEVMKHKKDTGAMSFLTKGFKKIKERERMYEEKTISEDTIKNVIRNNIDIESLKLAHGSHFNSNKKCELPKGSFRVTKKGYEEIFIPPSSNKSISLEKEISVEEIPEWMHPAFQAKNKEGEFYYTTTKFNKVQSKVLPTALYSNENMLICAPTSSGKTNIALLSILRLVSNYRDHNGHIDLSNFKIVYIAPMKALVKETVGNFSQKLSNFGLVVKELSGDINLTKRELQETNVIITTPEKWDIITRKAGERTFTEYVKLIIIDEIHLLHDTRGAVIESIVARIIRKTETSNYNIRMIALSATLPNYEDVGAFLRVDPDKGLFFFDNSYRPIPLEQRYIGITEKKSIKRMLLMNEITYEKVIERAGQKQIIIFVHSRRETLRTAKAIKDMAMGKDELSKFTNESRSYEYKVILNEDLPKIKDNELKELLPLGIAIHHAGLSRGDREIVEDYFNDGFIQIIVSTATLAWGVNLPAHTVIIKGTQLYDPEKGGWIELSPQDVLQMMGRAGRYGYGQNIGEGIIITSHQELQFYLSLLNQQLPIESQMIQSLADNLNAEIVLGTITNLKDAVNWLTYTYLYIRMIKNPDIYGISEEEVDRDPYLVQRRTDLIHSAANLLDKHGLIKYDRKSSIFQSTMLGRVSSYYYIKYQSMSIYNENLKPTIGIIDLFRLFSLSNEFKQIIIREEEKQEINKLAVKVPIPIKGSMEEPASKINVLLQAYISQFKLEGYALASDLVYVSQSAGRIFRALFEICLKRNWSNLAQISLNICKMIEKKMWSAMTPLRQFKNIQEEILYKIERKEQLTWDRFYDMTPEQIGELIKLPKQGKAIHKLVHTFPRVELEAAIQPLTRSCLLVDLIITPDFIWEDRYHSTSETFHILVEDNDSEVILHHEIFLLKKKKLKQDHHISFIVPVVDPLPPQYFIRVISDRWINCERLLPISFKHTILPEKFPPHTGLLDLQPLLFKALRYPEAEAIYNNNYSQMYPIQTQTFKTLYESDESIYIGAPSGSGKSLCAELAILRYLRQKYSGYKAPAIYVTPIEVLINDKYKEWNQFFTKLGYKVGILTGQLSLDNKIFDSSDLVMTAPDKLDMLTRRWKRKENIQAIDLVIVDEIHLLGESGSILEIVLSRLRFMASQLDKNIRFVALGTSLANPYNLADWLKINYNSVFNFNPNVRPNKLEIYIQGFDHVQRKLRLISMSKPVYSAIKSHASEKQPVIIYVSDRKQAKTIALDLLSFASIDDDLKKYTKVNSESIKDLLDNIDDVTLKHNLKYGIGYIHDGLTKYEKTVVSNLYSKNAIQVLILTHNMCWEFNLFCHLVIIMDPLKYDGIENRWLEYSIPDMLHMIGRASLSKYESSRKCMLLCQSSKKEFYKKFLYESFPLESHLNHFLNDHLNAEIVSQTIEKYQDCMDWLTWTYMYRRLNQNPNYYDVQGKTNIHINDYLSDLIEKSLNELKLANCINISGDQIIPLNYGRIAVFYYIKYNSIDLFSRGLSIETKKIRDLLEILCSAYEFEDLPIRNGEEHILRDLANSIRLELKSELYNEPHSKANILLQSYFTREPIPSDFIKDQRQIVENAQRLSLAMVDVLSSNGLLKQAIIAMELSQMIVQAMWVTQSPLFQLPYFSYDLVKKCSDEGIQDIPDLMNMEDDNREKLLQLNQKEMCEVAEVCNRYPSITMNVSLINTHVHDERYMIKQSEEIDISVQLERDYDLNTLSPVNSLYYPNEKEEAWWLIIGEPSTNTLLSIKRFTFVRDFKINFKINAPENTGPYSYSLYLLCDSWIGSDQEEKIMLNVIE